jgi:hypothetical protein
LHRQPLLDLDENPPFRSQCCHDVFGDAKAGIGVVEWHPRIGAVNLNPTPPLEGDVNPVVQADRLIHRQELVKAIPTRRANEQPEIDLCE